MKTCEEYSKEIYGIAGPNSVSEEVAHNIEVEMDWAARKHWDFCFVDLGFNVNSSFIKAVNKHFFSSGWVFEPYEKVKLHGKFVGTNKIIRLLKKLYIIT